MFIVQVIADSTGKWCGNALEFQTFEEAWNYAVDLYSRWTAVQHWRVLNKETMEVLKTTKE